MKKYITTFAASTLLAVSMARADVLNIALDVSGSTPIIQASYMRTALPLVGDTIAKLPIGSRVKVFSVGDDKATPMNLDLWVQRKSDSQGDTASELATKVPRLIAVYLNTLRAKPELTQSESSLSPAFLDSVKGCQPTKHCRTIFLTDGVEFIPGVISWHTQYDKPLPLIPGLDLKGMDVIMLGVGLGTSTQARIAIERHWENFLKASKAGNIDIRRL